MKFLYNNTNTEQQISAILQRIKMHMNGETASSMRINGLIYAKNYGVSITDLRKIAKGIEPNIRLAQQLWTLNIRETKIIATLLFQPTQTTREEARKLISECDNIELVEQLVMNLLRHLTFAPELIDEGIHSDNSLLKAMGFLLAVRYSDKLSDYEAEKIKDLCIAILTKTDNSYITHYAAICLAALCRHHKSIAEELRTVLSHAEYQPNNSTFDLVKQELIFLGYE